jgi:hypothetical protein
MTRFLQKQVVHAAYYNRDLDEDLPSCEFTAEAGDVFTLMCGMVHLDLDDPIALEIDGERVYEGAAGHDLLDVLATLGCRYVEEPVQ